MSHLSNDGLKELLDAGTEGICFHHSVKSLCGPCMEANQRLQPIPRRAPATTRNPDAEFGTDLHIDTVYATTPDIDGNRYQITVGDEKTTAPFIALSKTRGTIITKAAIKICENIKSRSGRKINSITIDRGTELFNHVLSDYCIKETGKPLRVSLTEKPWQNGLAERIQQTLWSMARADLKHADLPYSFWGPAVLNAATVILYRPVKRLGGKSFIHYVTKKPGDVTRFRVFGCPMSVFIRPRQRSHKLSNRAAEGIHLGPSTHSKGWRIYVPKTKQNRFADKQTYYVDPDDNMLKSTVKFAVIDSDDVVFNELFRDLRGRQMTIYPKGRKLQLEPVPSVTFNCPNVKQKPANSKMSLSTIAPQQQTVRLSAPATPYSYQDGIVVKQKLIAPTPDSNYYGHLEVWDDDVIENGDVTENADNENADNENTDNEIAHNEIADHKSADNEIADEKGADNENADAAIQPSARPRRNRAGVPPPKFDPDADTTESQLEYNQREFITPDNFGECENAFLAMEVEVPELVEEIKEHFACIATEPNPDKLQDLEPVHRKLCEDAIESERLGLLKKCVTEVPLKDVPAGTKIHRALLFLKTKLAEDSGEPTKLKARCCFMGAKGSFDASNMNVFAPCVRWMSVLIMLCLAAMMGWHFTGIDYSMAYLNAKLAVPVYMWPPKTMRRKDENGNLLIYHVTGCLYGHPESGARWNDLLVKTFKKHGFKQHQTDPCVFSKWEGRIFIFLLLHTDDGLLFSNDLTALANAKATLLSMFDGRDLGDVKTFCGVQINRRKDGISLNLKAYWNRVLKFAGLLQGPAVRRPINEKVSTIDCPETVIPEVRSVFWKLLGYIVYGTTKVRGDLIYATISLTRVMSNPAQKHLQQAKNLLSYIRNTIDLELNFFFDSRVKPGMDFEFKVWPDSSHADDEVTSRSTGGWYIFLGKGQGAISAKSSLRKTVTTSSTESEYCNYSDASKEGMFVKMFIEELNLFNKVTFDIPADSQPAVSALSKDVTQPRFRHIRIANHYIRELLKEGICTITKVSTHIHVGDLTTKPLSEMLVRKFRSIVLGNGIFNGND